MGQITDMKIRAYQELVGLKPATGKRADMLTQLQMFAFNLIKVCELERSGVRDGDGSWHGCDIVSELARDIYAVSRALPENGE